MKERKGFEKGTLAQLLIEKYFYKQRPPGERIPTLIFTKDQKNSWIIYGSELPKFQLVGVCAETKTHSYTHVIKMSF